MRISDWSSDVCSSDLPIDGGGSPARLNGLGRVATIAHPKVDHRVAVAPGIGVGRRLMRQIGHDRKHILGNNGIDVAQVDDRVMPALVAVPPGQEKIRDLPCCAGLGRSEEHTSEIQSLMRISYAVLCLKTKTNYSNTNKMINNDT